MKYAVEMKTGSGVQNFMRGEGSSHANRQQVDLINLLLYLENKESRLEMKTFQAFISLLRKQVRECQHSVTLRFSPTFA
jgi:hypothetical protein